MLDSRSNQADEKISDVDGRFRTTSLRILREIVEMVTCQTLASLRLN